MFQIFDDSYFCSRMSSKKHQPEIKGFCEVKHIGLVLEKFCREPFFFMDFMQLSENGC